MLDIRQKREEWNLWTGNQRHFARRCRNCGGRNVRPRTLRQSSGNLGDLKGGGIKTRARTCELFVWGSWKPDFLGNISLHSDKGHEKMWGVFFLDWKDILKIFWATMRAGKRLGGLLLCQACENNTVIMIIFIIVIIIVIVIIIIILSSPSSSSSSSASSPSPF